MVIFNNSKSAGVARIVVDLAAANGGAPPLGFDEHGAKQISVSSPREGITELRPRSALASTIATSTLKQRPLLAVTVS